jgi:hypothetical protein
VETGRRDSVTEKVDNQRLDFLHPVIRLQFAERFPVIKGTFDSNSRRSEKITRLESQADGGSGDFRNK